MNHGSEHDHEPGCHGRVVSKHRVDDDAHDDNGSSGSSSEKRRITTEDDSHSLGGSADNDIRRRRRNEREQRRSAQISEQFDALRDLMVHAGVIVPQGTRATILSAATQYIDLLQEKERKANE